MDMFDLVQQVLERDLWTGKARTRLIRELDAAFVIGPTPRAARRPVDVPRPSNETVPPCDRSRHPADEKRR